MSDKVFTHNKKHFKDLDPRQNSILTKLQYGKKYSLSEISALLSNKAPSTATLRRDIVALRNSGYLNQLGDRKSSRYTLTNFGMLNSPISAHEYCILDVDMRHGNEGYNFSLFQEIQNNIFSKEDVDTMNETTLKFLNRSKDASKTLKQKELERFVIELSWKSSKIEGNTYTLLDTERLLTEGIQAPGHTKNEAIMILNHKKAFQYIIEKPDQYSQISVRSIEEIHRILVEGLDVSFGLRSKQVGVTGSCYLPLSVPSQIREALEAACNAVENMENPYAKALIALIAISYIQPFEDGNKRTARLIANAILICHNCAPLSYRNVDEAHYRESMLVFYEKNSIIPIRDIFTKQYLFACEQYLKF